MIQRHTTSERFAIPTSLVKDGLHHTGFRGRQSNRKPHHIKRLVSQITEKRRKVSTVPVYRVSSQKSHHATDQSLLTFNFMKDGNEQLLF